MGKPKRPLRPKGAKPKEAAPPRVGELHPRHAVIAFLFAVFVGLFIGLPGFFHSSPPPPPPDATSALHALLERVASASSGADAAAAAAAAAGAMLAAPANDKKPVSAAALRAVLRKRWRRQPPLAALLSAHFRSGTQAAEASLREATGAGRAFNIGDRAR